MAVHSGYLLSVRRSRVYVYLCVVGSLLAGSTPLQAARPYQALRGVAEQLSRSDGAQRFRIELPVIDGQPTTVEVQPFTVWRKDARIVVHGASGEERLLAPPSTRFYRGRIVDVADSAVFFAVEPSGDASGMIAIGDHLFQIGRGVPVPGAPNIERRQAADDPLLIREFDTTDEILRGAKPFFCATEDSPIGNVRDRDRGVRRPPRPELNGAPNATYGLNLAIETDTELFAALGSEAAVTSYIADLVGQASVIYQRDLSTTLTIGTLHIWSGGTDPWTVSPPSDLSVAITELGTHWHNEFGSVARSTVVMVSGKAFDSGIAWNDVLCSSDFLCQDGSCGDSSLDGQFGGAYALIGARPGLPSTTVPDPTLTIDGVPYALPNTNDYWMLLAFVHELGHNANGPHTHCVALTEADKITYGVTRNYIDECFSGECFAGTPGAPPERGTIMSFCQNLVVSGVRQSRYLFWKSGETSEKILPFFTAGLEGATPDAAITIASNLSCSAGRTASVPNVAGNTYSWSMTGGTITLGASTSSITFTPSTSTVTVQVTISSPLGCSITSTATATTLCSTPSNVVATPASATSVTVTWSSVSGAAGYDVSRCTTVASCSVVGSPAGTSFTDTTATANTAYLYQVRSRDGGNNPSPYSAGDLATTVVFTDPVLTQTVTPIKAIHTNELRMAVNAVRVLAGLSAFTFTDPTLSSSVTVKRAHLMELRQVLDEARSTLALSTIVYTRPAITAGVSLVKAVDIHELRTGTQ